MAVESVERGDHDLGIEAGESKLAANLAHSSPKVNIFQQEREAAGKLLFVEGRHCKTTLAGEKSLAVAVDVVGNGGTAGQLPLRQGSRQALAARRMDQDVH